MDKLKALVVDDEIDAIEVLSKLLNDSGKVEKVCSVLESHKVECTIQKEKPDVLFMDIEMPDLNGLTILENIRSYNQEIPVVFVTAFTKYIPEAIMLNVFCYLEKPVNRKELLNLLEKLLLRKANEIILPEQRKIKLPVKDGYIFLTSGEIFLLEADGNYTSILTVDGQEYLSSYNMGRMVQRIPSGRFLRINRKTFLNSEYLVHINRKTLKCTARVKNKDYHYEVSKSFITNFNRESV